MHGTRTLARTLATLALLAFQTTTADAQVVRARLSDAAAGSPVSGAFVMLVDSAGAKAVGTLADSLGRLELRAPRPGSYMLRIERLGYETHQTGPYVLAAGEVFIRDLDVPGRAIVLPPIGATADNRCRGRGDMTGAAVAIWDEVRKTLAVASWTSSNERYQYDVVEIDRTYDREKRVHSEGTSERRIVNAGSPFESLPAEDLMSKGFVQAADRPDQWLYYGPDADVLQSDVFLDRHCFRPVTDSRQPSLVGLTFEPSSRKENSGIRGTLWIDRVSYGLDHVDFWFDWLPRDLRRDPFIGGRVDFRRLDSGIWIVPSWRLRIPQIGRDTSRRWTVDLYIEKAQSVTAAYHADGTPMRLERK